jgi:glycosidase
MYSSTDAKAKSKLTDDQRARGVKLMKLASLMQYTLPGVPCIYYADEVGFEGYEDPFSRQCYPWGRENVLLLNWYKKLGSMRKMVKALGSGQFVPGFEEQLVGMAEGEERDINITFPEQYVEDLAGKSVIFKVKVVDIVEK